MGIVLFESLKINHYRCIVIKKWWHIILFPTNTLLLDLDKVEKTKHGYELIKNDSDVLEWLRENIIGMAYIFILIDDGLVLDKITNSFTINLRRMRIFFTTKADAMAFKLRWL